MSEAERILALMGEPERLRVVAALALGASSITDVVRMTSLKPRVVEKSLGRLLAGGLVEAERGVYRLATEQILMAARKAAENRSPAAPGDILSRFMRDDRLTAIPASRSKRLIVLDHLAQEFEPGRRYPEAKVNEMLRRFHADVAALRRYLVDEGFMNRECGIYWRAGGTFHVD